MMSRACNRQEVRMFISAEDWYNQISLAWETYMSFRTSMATHGLYDEEFGLVNG